MRSCGFRKFWVCRSGNSDHLTRRSLGGAGRVKAEVLGADRRPIELEPATPLQDAIDDGLGEILVVEHAAPGIGMLVAGGDQRAAAGIAVVDAAAKRGAEERELHRALKREVEVVDGLEKGEGGAARKSLHASLLALRDLFSDEDGEEVLEGPLFLLGAHHHLAPGATGVGEVQAFEHAVDVHRIQLHSVSSFCSGAACARWWATYSWPKRPSARPRSKAARRASSPWCSSSSWRRSTARIHTRGRRGTSSVRDEGAAPPRPTRCSRLR